MRSSGVIGAMSIEAFCGDARISRAQFYVLDKKGLAPRTYRIGGRRFVAAEDASAWLRSLQGEAA